MLGPLTSILHLFFPHFPLDASPFKCSSQKLSRQRRYFGPKLHVECCGFLLAITQSTASVWGWCTVTRLCKRLCVSLDPPGPLSPLWQCDGTTYTRLNWGWWSRSRHLKARATHLTSGGTQPPNTRAPTHTAMILKELDFCAPQVATLIRVIIFLS